MTRKTGKLMTMALLSAVALIIFVVEAQIPALVPVPGVKPGLANIVTVYAVWSLVVYLPVLILCSVVMGLFTGLCAQLLLKRGKNLWKTIFK